MTIESIEVYLRKMAESKDTLSFLSRLFSMSEQTIKERLLHIADNIDITKHYDLIADYYKSYSLSSPEEARNRFLDTLKRYISA